MLFVPYLLGALVAWRGAGRLALLGISMTLLFISRESVLACWRARSRGRDPGSATRLMFLYSALAAAVASPLVFVSRLYWLVPLGLAAGTLLMWNARQAANREERTITTEVIGICGLTLSAGAAHYVGAGVWEPTAIWLWALSAAYFISSVFYVKLRVMVAHSSNPEAVNRISLQCTLYHALLAVGVATLVSAGRLSVLLIPAFLPVVARAAWHLIRPTKELVLSRIGRLEILYSVIFLVFAVLGFHSS